VVAALHARSVESPLPLLVAATVAKASPCLWPLPRAAPGPDGGRGGLDPGSGTFAGSILGCAAAWLPHQAERVAVGEEDGRLRVLPSSI